MPSKLLTNQQQKVVELMAAGLTRRQIALKLDLRPETAKKYLQRARQRAAARQATAGRYAKALSLGGKPVRLKPFSLLSTDHV